MKIKKKRKVPGWSRASASICDVWYPGCLDESMQVLDYAIRNKLNICPLGSGNSYGDEFQNKNNIVVNTSSMNKILSWDLNTGIMLVEPGVTLQQILRICLKDNWVLPVIPGTRFPTVGGATANNVHGKNSYIVGNFGDWVIEFDILIAKNKIVTCSRNQNTDLFCAAIGGLGMLGLFTSIKLQLKKIPSVNVLVKKWTVQNTKIMIEDIFEATKNSEYVISQIDCFADGKNLGRGTIHSASFIDQKQSNNDYLEDLKISNRIFSIIPTSWILGFGKICMSNVTMRTISTLKYYTDYLFSSNRGIVESFPSFNFLIDRIPDWPKVFKHGFYELEPLIPIENANKVIEEILTISHWYKMPPYLSGIKLHKKDNFLLSYSLNGFSVGFDFPVLPHKAEMQKEMFFKIHEIVTDNNGIIYLAKDNLVTPEHFKLMYNDRIDEFLTIKKQYDPNMLFQSNIFRRLFINLKN